MAVLLAPDVALLVLASTAAALVTGRFLPGAGRAARAAGVLAAVAGFAVVLALRGRWDPHPAAAGDWGIPAAAVTACAATCIALGLLAAWRPPRLRAGGIGVAAAAAAALAPHPRLSALAVCLPLAALLAAGLLEARPERAARRPAVALAAALAVAATASAAATAAVLVPAGGHPPDRRAPDALLAWAGDQLPDGARLVAPGPLWAELLHAGGDERAIRLPGTAGARSALSVGDGRPTAGARLVAMFGSPGWTRPFVVSDPHPGVPTAAELARRRSLATALLANPTTVAGGAAAEVIRAAAVDPRLLALLAALAARYGVGVSGFPAAPGEPAVPDDGVLARRVVVSSLGGTPLRPGTAATHRLQAWLDAQLPPFAPDSVTVTGTGVLIGFRYVSAPDALVSESAP